jgi:hypothetical protein
VVGDETEDNVTDDSVDNEAGDSESKCECHAIESGTSSNRSHVSETEPTISRQISSRAWAAGVPIGCYLVGLLFRSDRASVQRPSKPLTANQEEEVQIQNSLQWSPLCIAVKSSVPQGMFVCFDKRGWLVCRNSGDTEGCRESVRKRSRWRERLRRCCG